MSKKILILDGNQRSSLAATRSLGSSGYSVITADTSNKHLSAYSKHTLKSESYTSPYEDEEKFISDILSLIQKHNIDVLFPMTDITTPILLENNHLFTNKIDHLPSLESYLAATDKSCLIRLAEKLDIKTPTTLYFSNKYDIMTFLEKISYPIIVKPSYSKIKIQGKWGDTSVHKALNETELLSILDSYIYFDSSPFMLQEYIEGHGAGLFTLFKQAKPIVYFAHKRIKEKPPEGGISVLSESVEPDDQQKAISERILKYLKWHGVAMIEFRISKDGTPYLIEINGRFWGTLQLAIESGINFPLLLVQDSHCPQQYIKNIRLRWLLGDLDRLYILLKDSKYPINRKIRETLSFFNIINLNTKQDTNKLSDIKPFLYELSCYIKQVLRIKS